MSTYLITKWFGCFLLNDSYEIIKEHLFPHDEKSLIDILSNIKNNKILDIERKIASIHMPYIAEKRLQPIGIYQPNNEIFLNYHLDQKSYGYSLEILHEILCKISEQQVDFLLRLPDYQVIQQVNALDELQHIANVLNERITAWDLYSSKHRLQNPVKDVLVEVNKNQEVLKKQIESSVSDLAPNVSEIVGPMIAARLLSHAGSLRKLAMLPSSSIQLLGAEKALFRFKKQGGKPPKHGVIFQHPLISKAPYKKRGKHARLLSAKIAIAAKADMFTKRFIAPDLKSLLSDQIKNK